jgi:uncharacterized membrane protein (DUF106 family)
MVEEIPGLPRMTPIQLLEAQTQILAEIHQAHLEEINVLQTQTETLNSALMAITYRIQEQDFTNMKIEDINMPFLDLVSFMIKVTVAAIPSGLIIAIIYIILAGAWSFLEAVF